MRRNIKNRKFGKWRARKFLGQGGNGVVWLASNSAEEEAAIKLLTKFGNKSDAKMYARFKNEIAVVRANSDIEGLLPILDYYLPDEINDEVPWYVMPLAERLDKYLEDRDFEFGIQAVLEVARTLTKLHHKGIAHRDIKPANILVRADKFYVSDFGLVDYPDKEDLTSSGERIGAKWTVAPEMERSSTKADGKAADVYSLAKTLWILLTGHKYGFEGQYNPNSANALSRLRLTEAQSEGYFPLKASPIYIRPLDELLHESTDDDPLKRPSMNEFFERLLAWVDIYKDFSRRNPLQWQDVHSKLFPTILPQRAVWNRVDAIITVLNILSSTDYLNHMLLPTGGGMDLRGAIEGEEPETIELIIDKNASYLVKPRRLIFESFDFDLEWNYFRLETGDLEPTGIDSVYGKRESLVEIEPLQYISRDEWTRDRETDRSYPTESKFIWRYMSGDFLILQKTSLYNRIPSTYDGRHGQMGTDAFRDYIKDKVQLVQDIRLDKAAIKRAAERNMTIDDVIFAYLNHTFHQEYLEWRNREV